MSNSLARTQAAQICYEVVFKKHNLSELFIQRLSSNKFLETRSRIKSLCFETIRNYLLLESYWLGCVDKKPKDKLVQVVLTQALCEYKILKKPKHAVVNEAINTAKKLNKRWASGLINSCLRKAVTIENFIPTSQTAQFSHPQWWIDILKNDWQNDWQKLLDANNQKPPLWIRSQKNLDENLNPQVHEFIKNAYQIDAQDITQIDAFQRGDISVQDASAQVAAIILDPQKNERILDACAAPGGKTGHLLELSPDIKLDAIELYPNRAKKIEENLNRMNLKANIVIADTSKPETWFDGEKYDKILLDAPCSASGIVRRQPDIKFIRQAEDLVKICQNQQSLLSACAKLIKDGGKILYATCSVFKRENSQQIKTFLKTHPNFQEITLKYTFANKCEFGIQILTGTQNMDGFYYCYLQKCTTSAL